MTRKGSPLTFLVVLALALPATAAAQDTPAPTISKPTLSASGTIATKVKLRSSGKATVSRSARIIAADFPVQVSGALLTDAGVVLASQRGTDSVVYPASGEPFFD